jgi:hypothetical protein
MKRLVEIRTGFASDGQKGICDMAGKYFARRSLPGGYVTKRTSGESAAEKTSRCEVHRLSVESDFKETAEASVHHLADLMDVEGDPYPAWVSDAVFDHADLSIRTLKQPAEVEQFLRPSRGTDDSGWADRATKVSDKWSDIVSEHERWLSENGFWETGPNVSCSGYQPPKPEKTVPVKEADADESAIDDSGDEGDDGRNLWSTGIRYVR